MSFINPEDLLSATNGGLDIIISIYPDAAHCVDKPNRKFKKRNEKTASAKLNRLPNGTYVVFDFGGDNKSMDAIMCYAAEENLKYTDALKELASRYNVKSENGRVILTNKAEYSDRPANSDDQEGAWSYDLLESLEQIHIESIVSENVLISLSYRTTDEAKKREAIERIALKFREYNIYPVKSYSIVKNRKVMTFSATDRYPIFLIDEAIDDKNRFQKIYQPLHEDKGMRFMYVPGKKPSAFIHGLHQLNTAFEKHREEIEKQNSDAEDSGEKKVKKLKDDDLKLPEVILCTGGSDAINVALCGYRVIWLNSETETISQTNYNLISSKVKKFYVLGDIDLTGRKERHKLCMKFLEIYDIELPASLLTFKDKRGNPCKDVRDYLNHFKKKDFKLLVENSAMPYRFWEKKAQFNRSGDFIGYDYKIKNEYAYNFLQKNGFYRLPIGDKETDFAYIHIEGNTVKNTTAIKIKNFIKNFLRERHLDIDLRDEMHRTAQLNDNSLNALDEIEIDFTSADRNTQYLFFENKTLEITKDEIIEHKIGTVNKFVWADQIYPHRIKVDKTPPFEITRNELGEYDIKINDDSCLFLKYLIQTSRSHWRKELEEYLDKSQLTPAEKEQYLLDNKYKIDGPLLSAHEIAEQKMHLINKLFTIGYYLHSYKNSAKGWFAFGMDGKLNEDGQSHGGSGKSIMFGTAMKALTRKYFILAGRDPKINDNPHKYGGLTEHYKYVYIDDAYEYINLGLFYSEVTGDWSVNPKGKPGYVIPFENSPKLAMTSNFTSKNLDPSTERRIIYVVFSDYYHNKGESTDYLEARDPNSEFGKELFKDFTEQEWNSFYNTCINALKFYLSTDEKISPAMSNVNTRNLIAQMGPVFYDWAKTYFSEQGDKLDCFFPRNEPYEDYISKHNPIKFTAQSFKTKLAAFCKLQGYVFNPSKYKGKQGNIIQKWPKRIYDKKSNTWTEVAGEKVVTELFYIQTDHSVKVDETNYSADELIQHRLQQIEDKRLNESFNPINSPDPYATTNQFPL